MHIFDKHAILTIQYFTAKVNIIQDINYIFYLLYKKIILTDTVGFISKLPHNLVDAFSATLEEAQDANLILHVIDVSNPDYKSQMQVVEEVLKQNNITAPIINVYNKCDKTDSRQETNGIYISAKQKIGIDELKEQIKSYIK